MMLHKLRRAMVNLEREPLRGEVEVDETWIGGTQAGLRGSRQLKGRKAALVLVAVEKRDRGSGRMAFISDFRSATLLAFLKQNLATNTIVYTDGLKSFTGLEQAGFRHIPHIQPLQSDLRKGAKSVVPFADRAIGNFQQWLIGTHHGVSRDELQVYLHEFVVRHDRSRHPWLHSRPCLVWAPRINLRLTPRSEVLPTSSDHPKMAESQPIGSC